MEKASLLHKNKNLMSRGKVSFSQHQERDGKLRLLPDTATGIALAGPPNWGTRPASAAPSGGPNSHHNTVGNPRTSSTRGLGECDQFAVEPKLSGSDGLGCWHMTTGGGHSW